MNISQDLYTFGNGSCRGELSGGLYSSIAAMYLAPEAARDRPAFAPFQRSRIF
jgi:hypothetical protein